MLNKLFESYRLHEWFFPLIGSVLEQTQQGLVFVDNVEDPELIFVVHKFAFAQIITKSHSEKIWEQINSVLESGIYFGEKPIKKIRLYDVSKDFVIYLNKQSTLNIQQGTRVRFKYPNREKFHDCLYVDMVESDFEVINTQLGIEAGQRFWSSKMDFLKNSLAYYIKEGNNIKSICYSAAVSDSKAEIDVATHSNFRMLGFAKKAVKGFINNCFKEQVIPFWDCYENNKASMNTAASIGFTELYRYQFLIITIK